MIFTNFQGVEIGGLQIIHFASFFYHKQLAVLLTKQEVRMAGYWSSSFFVCVSIFVHKCAGKE